MALNIDLTDIQICMLTRNEGLLLEYTLSSLKDKFSKFAIIDESSGDQTVDIIHDMLGDKVDLVVEPEGYIREIGFAGARNKVSDMCSKPWILHVDADEDLTCPTGDTAVHSIQADAEARFLTVPRFNLGSDPDVSLPLTPEKISQLPVVSRESHVRLYQNHAGFQWRSFIHEELWHNGNRLPYACPEASISLNHLSRFKGYESAQRKEEFYGWMLMKGSNKQHDQEKGLSNYCLAVLGERRDYFARMSEAYEKCLNQR